MPASSTIFRLAVLAAISFALEVSVGASETPAVTHFRKEIQPLMTEYCGDCHFDGAKKGNVAFDGFKTDAELLENRDLWLKALKNVRAGLMPPAKKPHPSAEQIQKLAAFVKSDVFEIDPANPDPGKVTIRRLNRNEYRNTIRDLTGFDYKVEEELPPDDTGYGFDTIGDVLTMSPLLMEKYMEAAEKVTTASVPRTSLMVPEKTIVEPTRRGQGGRHSFYEESTLKHSFHAPHTGTYKVLFELETLGQFDFDPGECHVSLKAGDEEIWAQDFKWQSYKLANFEVDRKWSGGDRPLVFEIKPLVDKEKKKNSLELRLASLKVEGPMEKEFWTRPKNFERFFTKDPPTDAKARREYAAEVLKRFAEKAYRRPVDARTVERLAKLAESIYTQPGKKFEDGIAETMTPILASPRFLFRIEEVEPTSDAKNFPLLDEYSLASRLSYFLWSTMPDDELFQLARKHELRKNLDAQLKRMLEDSRSDALVQNFVGQWLQVRDVEGIDINAREVLNADRGEQGDRQKKMQRFRALRDIEEDKLTPEEKKELTDLRAVLFRQNTIELDGNLRKALKDEADKVFAYIARGDRSVLELIDCDYTFLNERLAKHYGIDGVSGTEMRLVKLPENSPRGGVLTMGAPLIVTSNPTRTSAVKRGLFILDNILGMPPPPPPPDIPPLEESQKEAKSTSLRATLELHRSKPLCHSCHNRMDPLGFALENFNALGMWRDKERGQPIDASGSLVTGEEFKDVREVKKVLATKYRESFYRCLTEKMLIYALGRGLEYYDTETVDRIVERLSRENGRFSVLLSGIVESAPFEKRRNPEEKDNLQPVKPTGQRASIN
jgi:mono/diheme cytochrome c family protein